MRMTHAVKQLRVPKSEVRNTETRNTQARMAVVQVFRFATRALSLPRLVDTWPPTASRGGENGHLARTNKLCEWGGRCGPLAHIAHQPGPVRVEVEVLEANASR
jgi:hypothetical protein